MRTFLIAVVMSIALGAQSPQIPPPPDVASAPADAAKTSSGLATKVISELLT